MWAWRRKAIIFTILGGVAFVLIASTSFAVFYESPSCLDHKQNQDETGVDCGGSCTYLCTAQQTPLKVLFARPVTQGSGRTDVISYIENINAHARAERAPYTLTLYDEDNLVIAKKSGVLSIPPVTTVPVFITNLTNGYRAVTRAFLTIDDASVVFVNKDKVSVPLAVRNEVLTNGDTPRLTATIHNAGAVPLFAVPVVATVFDGGNAIASSATVIDVPAQGESELIFTWSAPFTGTALRTEIIPVTDSK